MKKSYKWPIGIITITILLIVALVILQNRQESTTDELTNNSPIEQQVSIFPDDFDVKEIHLQLRNKDAIVLNKGDRDEWDVLNAKEKISQFKVDKTVYLIQGMIGFSDDSITLEEAGLVENAKTIKFIDQSGQEKTLNIGQRDNETFTYHVAFDDDEQMIYRVNAQLIDELPRTLADLHDRSVVSIKPQDVNKITIQNSIQTIELIPESPYSEAEMRTNLSGWFMHQPYQHVYSVKFDEMENMIYGLNYLEWEKIINDDGSNLEEYGLTDSNFIITFQSDEYEDTIIIGAPATGTTYYAMMEDDQRVFTIDNQVLHPYSYQAFDLIEKFVKIIAIDDLKGMQIHDNDHNFDITIDHDENKDHPTFHINGQEIEDQDFRNLYKVIAGLSVSSVANDAVYDTPEATMTYVIHDKTSDEKIIEIDFVDYDQDNYAVFINNQADFLVKKDDFKHMINEVNNQL